MGHLKDSLEIKELIFQESIFSRIQFWSVVAFKVKRFFLIVQDIDQVSTQNILTWVFDVKIFQAL